MNRIMRISFEKKLLLTILCLAAFALVVVFVIIVPTLNHIKEMDRQTYNLRLNMERKLKQSIDARSSIQQLEHVEKSAASLPLHLFTAGQELALVTLLEDLAATARVTQKINSSNLDVITNNRIVLSLTVSGSLEQCLIYLKNLEAAPYFINVTKAQITPETAPGGGNSTRAILQLDLSLYVNS